MGISSKSNAAVFAEAKQLEVENINKIIVLDETVRPGLQVAQARLLPENLDMVLEAPVGATTLITGCKLGVEGEPTRELGLQEAKAKLLPTVAKVELDYSIDQVPRFNTGMAKQLHMQSTRISRYEEVGKRVYASDMELCNAVVVPSKKIMYVINEAGSRKWMKTGFKVYLPKATVSIECANEEIINLHKLIRKENPSLYIEDIGEFSKYVQTQIEQHEEDMEVLTVCNIPGWIKNDNRLYYNSAKLPNTDVKRKLLNVKGEDSWKIAEEGMNFLDIGNMNSQIVSLFVSAHIAYLTPWLDEVKHPARFIVCLVGASNSLKTSVSRELFNLFVPESERLFSFQSTQKGLELAASNARHDTFIVDDVAPASSSTSRANECRALENVERLSRIFSDDSMAVKATPSWGKTIQLAPKGLCVVTAEFLAGSLSTRSRQLWINVNRETFSGPVLRYFQTNPEVMQRYFSLFVDYIECNQDIISSILEAGIAHYKSKIPSEYWQRISTPRSKENLVVLLATLGVVKHFLGVHKLAIAEELMLDGLIKTILESNRAVDVKDPVKQFISNLEFLIDDDCCLCTDSKDEFTVNDQSLLVDADKKLVWGRPNVIYKAVYELALESGDPIILTKMQLQKSLRDAEIIICDDQGYTRKTTFKVGNSRKNLLCIALDALPNALPKINKVLEEIEDEQ